MKSLPESTPRSGTDDPCELGLQARATLHIDGVLRRPTETADGIRDLWSPYGDGDLLKVALNFAVLNRARHDEELTAVVRRASTDAARFIGAQSQDLVAGAVADIVLIDAENPMDALVRMPTRDVVIASGVVHDYRP